MNSEIRPPDATIDEPPDTPPETHADQEKKEVIEKFRHERLKIIADFAHKLGQNEKFKRLISGAFNVTVGSYIKLPIEAYRGETIQGKDLKGQKLTPCGRVMNVIIAASGLGSYVAAIFFRRPDVAAALYSTSWVTLLLMYGADTLGTILDKAAKKSEERGLDFHEFLRACSSILSKSKSVFIEPDDESK